MDAIKLLDQQHDDIDELFEQFAHADDEREQRRLFAQIADQLVIHTTLEERHFYPAVRSGDTEEIISRSFDDHAEVKRLIAELLARETIDAEFIDLCQVLRGEVERHVDEERHELFPLVRRQYDADQLDVLGDEMNDTRTELLELGEPRRAVLGEPAGAHP